MAEGTVDDLYSRIESLKYENTKLVNIVNFLLENLSDITYTFGEHYNEKTSILEDLKKANATLDAMENDNIEYVRLFARMQKEATQIEKQKKTLIENEYDMLRQLGEIAEEKNRIAIEREMIEEQSMEIAKSLGEVFMEKRTIEQLNKELEQKTAEAQFARKQTQSLLNKIFPAEISNEMMQGNSNFKNLNCTIAFSDIKKFSNYAKNKKPGQIADEIKKYYNDVDTVLKTHSGWLVKYIGDSAMMLFGVPYLSRSHAMDACLTALRIKELSSKHPWDTRFGINTGPVTVGDIGSVNRPQYDAIGDAVNIAARLEQLGKKENKDIIITLDTFVKIHKFFHCQFLGEINLKGVGEHRLYDVQSLKGIFDNDLRVAPESLLAKKYTPLEDEIKERIKTLFGDFDFLKLESKDGSLNHSLAVSVLSVALKRELGLSNIDEDNLIIISCAHDMGKIYIKSKVLKKDELTEAEQKVVSKLGDFSIKVMEKLNLHTNKIPLVKELFNNKNNDISAQIKIVRIANKYDGYIFPKYYIGERKTIQEACEAIRQEFTGSEVETFINLVKET